MSPELTFDTLRESASDVEQPNIACRSHTAVAAWPFGFGISRLCPHIHACARERYICIFRPSPPRRVRYIVSAHRAWQREGECHAQVPWNELLRHLRPSGNVDVAEGSKYRSVVLLNVALAPDAPLCHDVRWTRGFLPRAYGLYCFRRCRDFILH